MEQASDRVPRQALLTTLGLSAVLHAAALVYLAPRWAADNEEAVVAGPLRVSIVRPAPDPEPEAPPLAEATQDTPQEASSEAVAAPPAPQSVEPVRPQPVAVVERPRVKPEAARKPRQDKPSPAPRSVTPTPARRTPVAPAAASAAVTPVVPLQSPPRFDADYLHNPPPAYPPLARRMHLEGRVVLRVHVGHEGRPLEVLVDTGSGYDILDRAALDAVRRWRFVPARRGAEAIAAWVRVPLAFHIAGQ